MNIDEFNRYGHQLIDFITQYYKDIENLPVLPRVEPGDIFNKIEDEAPLNALPFEKTFDEFEKKIMPGITHWQHPSFMGYFPASSSFPSILGELLTSAIGAQCMSWQTSPAATELEEKTMIWLRKMIGLPESFTGVIEDTASTSTLCSILTARERATNFSVNTKGFESNSFTLYCSEEAHSSIEKGVKIAGFGKDNLRKIEVDENFAMIPELLEKQIEIDLINGKKPIYVVAAFGTTGSTAVDNIREIGNICRKYGLWLHVDAAFAGSALIMPEYRHMIDGIELADSFVFNPHKWLLTNFDCSAYFVQDKEALIKTFELLPEYLKTNADSRVNNYRDWGIQLGRRFRALKLWFVIRTYGVSGLQDKLRKQLDLTKELLQKLDARDDIEILAPVHFNLICFRYKPEGNLSNEKLNELNANLMNQINSSGKAFISHTKLRDKYTLRVHLGQNLIEQKHMLNFYDILSQSIAILNK